MGLPRVSVVVPCYNYRHFLSDSVGSALGQEGVDLEVVIVDDASSDGSVDLANEIATKDSRVRVLEHKHNAGHIATYNEGLAAATGDYLVLLSADDMLTGGSLLRATALMEANPSVGMTYGRVIQLRTATPPPARVGRIRWRVWKGADWLALRATSGRNVIMCPEVVMRADAYRNVGPYRADLPHSGDFAMWLAAATVADVGFVGGCDQAYYRVHGQNMHMTTFDIDKDDGLLSDLTYRSMAFEAVLPTAAGGENLLVSARRALAKEAVGYVSAAYESGRTAREPIDGYVGFACRMWPDVELSNVWRAMQRRARRGPEQAQRWPPFRARLLLRDLEGRLRWRRWRRTGNH